MKRIVLAMTLLLTIGLIAQSFRSDRGKPELKTAIFAGGCYWGVQHAFDHEPGVVSTEAGYTGGTDPHPTHSSVSLGHTGHVEAVRVTYDARKVSYGELLDTFWSCHNPTLDLSTGKGEGPGRSMIFVADSLQNRLARQAINELTDDEQYDAPIMTRIEPASTFYRAEAEQQHFADRNGASGRCAAPGPAVHTHVAACARGIRTATVN